MITADQIARVWEQTLREMPDPWREESPFVTAVFGGPSLSYRDRLTRRRRNHYGEVIPQITLVRANLRRLGTPRVPPRIPA